MTQTVKYQLCIVWAWVHIPRNHIKNVGDSFIHVSPDFLSIFLQPLLPPCPHSLETPPLVQTYVPPALPIDSFSLSYQHGLIPLYHPRPIGALSTRTPYPPLSQHPEKATAPKDQIDTSTKKHLKYISQLHVPRSKPQTTKMNRQDNMYGPDTSNFIVERLRNAVQLAHKDKDFTSHEYLRLRSLKRV